MSLTAHLQTQQMLREGAGKAVLVQVAQRITERRRREDCCIIPPNNVCTGCQRGDTARAIAHSCPKLSPLHVGKQIWHAKAHVYGLVCIPATRSLFVLGWTP